MKYVSRNKSERFKSTYEFYDVSQKVTANGWVLPKAGYSAFRQPIPELIYFLFAEDNICCQIEFRRPDN